MKKATSKFGDARNMPPLYHTRPGEPFDIFSSDVIRWLFQSPDIRQYAFDKARALGYIEYDAETGKWRGVDWHD